MILIPESSWASLLDEFARVGRAVERVAYLDGIRQGSIGVVTSITIPEADLHPGHYDVSAEAMSQAGQHFRQYGLERLAQVHTHRGDWCNHSPRDDERAYSLRDGSVSIVLPHHALNRPGPADGVVHVRRAGQWQALSVDEASAFVRLVPSLLDFRSSQWFVSPIATKATSAGAWSRLARRVLRWWPFRSRET